MRQPKYKPLVTEFKQPNQNFSEKNSENNLEKVEIFFTENPILLQQYYKLREEIYRNDLGFIEYDGSENEYDKKGRILLAVFKGQVVGGARLDFSNEHKFLFNEQPNKGIIYKDILRKYIPEFSETDTYAEICAFVVKKMFRKYDVFASIHNIIVNYAIKSGCKYLIGSALKSGSRLYGALYKKLGYDFKILYDMGVPASKIYSSNSNLITFPIFIKLKNIN